MSLGPSFKNGTFKGKTDPRSEAHLQQMRLRAIAAHHASGRFIQTLKLMLAVVFLVLACLMGRRYLGL